MISRNEKLLASAAHLGLWVGLPVGLPLIIYIMQRDQSPFVARQARQALGFQIAVIACGLILVMGFFGLATFASTVDAGPVASLLPFTLFPALAIIGFATLLTTISAVLKVARGEPYTYPVIGTLVDRRLK
jgi:uncharacterized Tic20 family protein